MTIFNILMVITGISIVVFIGGWTYIRWQKIARNNKQEWHRTAFYIMAGIAGTLVGVSTIVYFAIGS